MNIKSRNIKNIITLGGIHIKSLKYLGGKSVQLEKALYHKSINVHVRHNTVL
jgi:hypothetical protein